jgi:PAS domain S-box-containing protein
LTRHQAAEVIGKKLDLLFPDRSRESSLARVALAGQGDSLERQDIPILRADGVVRSVLWSSANIYDTAGGGTLLAVIAQGQDITESNELAARYRGLLEAAPDAMVVVNGAGEIVLLNLQAEKQFGYHRDELVGQQVTNIIPEGFAERIIADDLRSAADALAQQIGTGLELVALRKDGTEFPIEIMLSPLESAEGILVTAAIRDISARKAAEEALRRTSSYLENLIDYANAPIIVWDPDLRITRFNLAFERLTRHQAAEVIGKKLDLLFPDRSRESSLARVALAGQGDSLERQDIPILRADGVVRSVLWSSANIYDTAGGGTLLAVIAQGQDITESNELAARYRGLLEAAPDAMVVVNGAGEIVLLNLQAEKQFGYHRDELVGQQVTNIIPEGFAERIIADDLRSAADALAQQIGTGLELVALRKDGTEFPIELMLSPLEGSEGILVTAAIRDISARKAAEASLLQKVDELARSNEELGQFAYIASHDLQEPLRMVASYTQLLSRRYTGRLDADADEFIAFAVDGASRMQRLIEDLLAYSRVGTRGIDLVCTSSEDAFGRALVNLRGSIEESGAKVTHDPLPEVLADEHQLVQLFQNLVGNAIKYRRAGVPRVHVSAVRNANGNWRYAVKDNGIGIDPQYFERIFGMFQRLHKRDEFAGTGIGLAICKKIVERHGGTISVESQPGHGSTFHFTVAGSGAQP